MRTEVTSVLFSALSLQPQPLRCLVHSVYLENVCWVNEWIFIVEMRSSRTAAGQASRSSVSRLIALLPQWLMSERLKVDLHRKRKPKFHSDIQWWIYKLLFSHWTEFSWLCNGMDYGTPGFPVLHYHLLGFAQIHVHWVGDAIQPSHPLSSPSPPAFNLSQHQGLFQWVGSSHQVAKGLEFQLQCQSFQWIFRDDFLKDWLVWSPCYPRDSPTPQFEGINSSVLSLFYCPALTSIWDYWKNHSFDHTDLCWQSDVSAF